MNTTPSLSALLLCLGLAGCGAASEEPEHVEISTRARGEAPLPGFPTRLLTAPGSGPALFLGPEEDARAIGYVSAGVPVLVKSSPVGDRVRVLIDGPIKTRGWLRLARLGGYVTHGGRVRGAPASVHPCDLVGVRSLDDDGQSLHVTVAPVLGVPDAPALGPYEGIIPVTAISADRPDAAQCTLPSGEFVRLPAAQAVDVYDHPNGQVIAQLPAMATGLVVNVARRSGDWAAVRVGTGPFLVGYVRATLTPAEAPAAAAVEGPAAATTGVPQRIQAEPSRPLLRVHQGARVRFDLETIGILAHEAYAREMQRYPTGEIDVYVAANDDLALRGMVRATDVDAILEEPPGGHPDAAPPPATDADAGVAPAPPPPPPPLPSEPDAGAPRPPPRPLGIY